MPNGSERRYGSFLAASSKGRLWPIAAYTLLVATLIFGGQVP